MTETASPPESQLPYSSWTEEALRAVPRDALRHVAKHGLPGEHHFYLTFRTDAPGVHLPGHLKARYPEEMTIVLQHKFWDLSVDASGSSFSVGLSFGGVPAMLTIPFAALTAFADPHVRFGLRFQPPEPVAAAVPDAPPAVAAGAPEAEAKPQVVSLDAFRRKRE
ncbi:ClpXP protease specificity-enhancing factor SspB [Siccirubricoccus sp. KC 17139]|uniref:ClpXP protease specificity-enhancing factor SspB n=1 Tax=Siccirubricoccus soli TaxID=2899147 RepID=A0ABT1D7I9_9PROT|nr:ClpXP protease specificity-enhancing factor SspB [Siccirubricoccus soli]MCO6417913.1 ClpXP protease specificity-enhancing factor SspB [Siccirubricoccus soli]MCP2684048.1 ClpXP protease specificity-enhancing factor SspB [Siccirubricoccus soli]